MYMVDQVVVPTPEPAATVQPVVTPQVSPTVAPAEPVQTTVLGAEPVVAPEVKTVEPAAVTTVVPEVKTDIKPPEGATTQPSTEPKVESTQSAEPAPLPVYEPFKLPEGLTSDEEGFGHLNKMLGEFEVLTKADHAEVQKLGQTLVDRHVAQLQKTVQAVQEASRLQQEQKIESWKQSFISDPEIGGNRQETTLNSALKFIRTHGGTDEQQAEIRSFFNETGVGNHPALIRLLAKAGSAMSEGKPLPAKAPAPEKQSKPTKFYGGNTR